MKDNAEILKLRVLLCFWKLSPADRSVTGIARTLGKEKYAVSRAVSSLEKDGLVQRENARSPQLTEAGRQAASRYSERFETALNHLLYEGVDLESAKQDAFVWTLYCTDSTMETVRATEERYRVKYELRGQKQFSGAVQKTEGRLLFAAVPDLPRAYQGRQQPFHGERGLRAPLQPVCERR